MLVEGSGVSAALVVTVNVVGVGPERAASDGAPLFGRFAHGRYTERVGLSRLLDAFAEFGISATFFWPSTEAEAMPALLERCLREGHEVAAHGRAFEDHAALDPGREAEILEEAHSFLEARCGAAPKGFRSPTGTLSHRIIPILRGLGYCYDSSFVDDDAPYSLAADGGGTMVSVELPRFDGRFRG